MQNEEQTNQQTYKEHEIRQKGKRNLFLNANFKFSAIYKRFSAI